MVALKIAGVAALLGVAAVALLVTRQGPAVLLSARTDLDAPTMQDLAFVKTGPAKGLRAKNQNLKSQVKTLEQEVQTLSQDLTKTNGRTAAPRAAAPRATTQGLHGMQKRVAWAKQAMQQPWQSQMLGASSGTSVGKRGLSHEIKVDSPFYSTSRADPMGSESLATKAGDSNWINALKPGYYWKDPYERPFLHAPGPHDPSSSLAHTVTGDYASPATWGDIYQNKESIDWCTENFPWFEDRIKCIRKIHAQGPLLG